LVVLGVFLVDLIATVVRRALSRRPLFAGDRSHLYDRLRARGWPIPGVAVSSAVVQALFVLLAVALESADAGWWALGALAWAIGLLLAVFWSSGLFQPDPV
jgi:UDP-N-acetylmuramyl pentapeptide phosphotransferase/UDP-N-acetylglucosamine-1-phosphate transferase